MVTLWLCVALPVSADDSDKNEGDYRVRVALLYNFLKFVNWPDDVSPVKSGKANVCIIGDKGFSTYFVHFISLSNVHRQSPAINIREADNNLESCHIIFVGNNEENDLGTLLAQTKHSHILSISEKKGFADNGGVIEIVRVDKSVGLFSKDKINLRINLKNATDNGLLIDARLLQIAVEVIKPH